MVSIVQTVIEEKLLFEAICLTGYLVKIHIYQISCSWPWSPDCGHCCTWGLNQMFQLPFVDKDNIYVHPEYGIIPNFLFWLQCRFQVYSKHHLFLLINYQQVRQVVGLSMTKQMTFFLVELQKSLSLLVHSYLLGSELQTISKAYEVPVSMLDSFIYFGPSSNNIKQVLYSFRQEKIKAQKK